MKRRILSWANTIKNISGTQLIMVTLTYREISGWKPNHIRDYMKKMRKILGRDLRAYAWVAEMQERGAVHYHLVLCVNSGTRIPMPDRSGFWDYGLSRVEIARTPYYLVLYYGKKYQKDFEKFPKGARCFAIWLDCEELKDTCAWLGLSSAQQLWIDQIGADEIRMCMRNWKGAGDWKFSDVCDTEEIGLSHLAADQVKSYLRKNFFSPYYIGGQNASENSRDRVGNFQVGQRNNVL
jgi:hypothetical protein